MLPQSGDLFFVTYYLKKNSSDTFLSIFGFGGISSSDNLVSKVIVHNFLQWFVGFTDAEGSFSIHLKIRV